MNVLYDDNSCMNYCPYLNRDKEFIHFNKENDSCFYLPDDIDKKVLDGIRLYKYMPIDYFLKNYFGNYFYLADPHEWEDPMEVEYIDHINQYSSPNYCVNEHNTMANKEIHKRPEFYVYGTCFTINHTKNEGANWKLYGKTSSVIRITFNVSKLIEGLSQQDDFKAFLSRVRYMLRVDIKKGMPVNSDKNYDRPFELYANNFLLKQEAYYYEHEVRLGVADPNSIYDKKKPHGIRLPFDFTKGSIEYITLPPIVKSHCDENRDVDINYNILRKLCPNIEIRVSNLYNPSEDKMSSKYIPISDR